MERPLTKAPPTTVEVVLRKSRRLTSIGDLFGSFMSSNIRWNFQSQMRCCDRSLNYPRFTVCLVIAHLRSRRSDFPLMCDAQLHLQTNARATVWDGEKSNLFPRRLSNI